MYSSKISFIAGLLPSAWLFRQIQPTTVFPFYHTVSDEYLPHIHPLYATKTNKTFEQDIDFLLRHFQPVGLEEATMTNNNNKKLRVHLTFDDGLRGVYENALPLLWRKGVPATIFVNPRFVNNRDMFYRHKAAVLIYRLKPDEVERKQILSTTYTNRDYIDELANRTGIDFDEYLKQYQPYLTIDELKSMQAKGFTIGAHSIDHPNFAELAEAEQIRQVVESCNYVQRTFQEKHRYFSFPFSDEGLSESLFSAIENEVDASFGITGISRKNKHFGRIDMEKNGKNAKATINRSVLKYKLKTC